MTPEEILLMHGDLPYDASKAHEYYLRNRKLKGREAGGQDDVHSSRTSKGRAATAAKLSKRAGPPRLTSKQRQDAVNGRVASLRKRLDRLKVVLEDLLKEAQKHDGKKDEPAKKEENKAGTDKKSELTTKQKREAAVRSKEYYEKNKKPADKFDSEQSQMDIKKVRAKIREIRAQLRAAIEKARRQSSNIKTVKGR